MRKTLTMLGLVVFISGCSGKPVTLKLHAPADSALIEQHLKAITKTDGYRNYENVPLLDQTAEYIFSVFSQYTDTTRYQTYQVNGETYRNVICRLGSASNTPLVVIGAHYDVAGNQEGADDNASGVVGLLELVRMLSQEKLNYPVEIVAYSLEEPPFFKTENMGSYIHAKSLHDAGTPVYGMAALEMIGYFDDKPGSQSYPAGVMKYIYGNKGDFIGLVGKVGSGKFLKEFWANFKKAADIKTHTIKMPPWGMTGIDYSDHLNYWKFGYDAFMITDTSFYRNHNYHQKSDTMDTLDIPQMMKVIDAVAAAIVHL
ncbi:MAG: M28 family peptidase [Syntrophobacterales bacterium]|jgi:Zn-dependent M28 family amino/carboxypeptidase|nr:M28 family peptidase [Syntrophobacterales bacterium]